MRHRNALGWLFVVWAALHVIFGVVLLSTMTDPPSGLALGFLVAAVFAWGAYRLVRSPQPAWLLGVGLSLAALLSFPVGTLIGAYGLWVALARADQLGGAPRLPWKRQALP
jgi:hypothetical protein